MSFDEEKKQPPPTRSLLRETTGDLQTDSCCLLMGDRRVSSEQHEFDALFTRCHLLIKGSMTSSGLNRAVASAPFVNKRTYMT